MPHSPYAHTTEMMLQEMRAEVELYTGSSEPGVRKKVFADGGHGIQVNFQSGCPDDEPYRVLLMAIRRRLYKSRLRMEESYLGSPDGKQADPDVYTKSTELLEPLELMYRSLVAVGDRVLERGADQSAHR